MVGRTLGHYRVLEKIGAGGMGEVYRAQDTRLGRDVAVKVLPDAFARNPDRVARLRREAQVLATLNHPHIASIYDLDESEQHFLLALELVPGPSLAERLARGPLPVAEALPVARQIADALEAAHGKGIVHRDLKPANVKITPAGQVKLLDFGLAKTGAPGSPGSDPGNLPTATQFTEAGAVMGTIGYMSPEQARAQPVDERCDIWAFGCLLYEMLAGRPLFAGRTASDILASILRDDVKLDGLPPDTPPGVRLLVERCLRRDLNRRLRHIGDARIEIEDAIAGAPAAPVPALAAPGPIGSRVVWLLAGVLLACAVFGAWWLRFRPAPAVARNVQFQRITDFVGNEESPAISPDGKTVAFVALAGARRHIWLRLLAGGAPLQITHDDTDHEEPRWAPDSGSLIYYSPPGAAAEQGALWEISALGGAPRRIGSAISGGDISHDGRRVAAFQVQGGRTVLTSLPRESGSEQVIRALDINRYDHPRWSPDDRRIAFRRSMADVFLEAVYVISADGGEPRVVVSGDYLRGVCWLPDGSGLVYSSSAGSTVLYPPVFNLKTVRLDAAGERQLTFGDVSYVEPDMHASGKLLASRIRVQSDIWRFPIAGSAAENSLRGVQITHQTAQVQTPSVSPDGKQIVYLSDSGGHGNLWIANTDGTGVRQITFEREPATAVGVPVWSPDGDQIVFILTRAGNTGEWVVRPDGSGLHMFVPKGSGAYWSPDKRWFYYSPYYGTDWCIDKIPVGGGEPVRVRCQNAFIMIGVASDSTLYYVQQLSGDARSFEICKARPENGPCQTLGRVAGSRVPFNPALFQAVLSPDDRWLAMPLLTGDTTNLWLQPADGGPIRQVTDFGQRSILIARRVSWSPDSKSIYAAVAEPDADVVLLDGLIP